MKLLRQILITSRPVGWFIFILSYLGGVIVSNKYFSLQQTITIILIGPILSFLIYAFNDIYDYESDIRNQRKQLKIMGGVLNKEYWKAFERISIFLILLLLIIPLIFGNWPGLLFILFGLFIGIGYSVPPIRLKTRLGGDIASCCLGFFALFGLGMSENLTLNNFGHSLKYLIFSTFMVAIWSLLFLGIDYHSDKEAQHYTTAHKFSYNQVMIASAIGYFLAALGIYLLFNQLLMCTLLAICSGIILLGLKFKTSKFNIFIVISVTLLSAIAYSSLYLPFLI